jgi:alcohol dehydrogenase class IV
MALALGLVAPDAPLREAALAAAQAVAGLVRQLELPRRLREVNVPVEALEGIADGTVAVFTTATVPPPTRLEVLEILQRAW